MLKNLTLANSVIPSDPLCHPEFVSGETEGLKGGAEESPTKSSNL